MFAELYSTFFVFKAVSVFYRLLSCILFVNIVKLFVHFRIVKSCFSKIYSNIDFIFIYSKNLNIEQNN